MDVAMSCYEDVDFIGHPSEQFDFFQSASKGFYKITFVPFFPQSNHDILSGNTSFCLIILLRHFLKYSERVDIVLSDKCEARGCWLFGA